LSSALKDFLGQNEQFKFPSHRKEKNFFSDFLFSFLQHLFVARVKEDKSHGIIQKMLEKRICFEIEGLNWFVFA
jgi:hypothetical protein